MNRNLKVGYNTRETGRPRTTKFFPQLILQGDWLQNAGFQTGNETAVTVTPGKIEIVLKPSAL